MDDESDLSIAADWLREARNVVVFTGAGASAESGIPTFRDDDGFWQEFPVDEFATWRGIVRTALVQPRRLAEFAYAVLHPMAIAKPNAGHLAIADMERHTRVTVVTQNVDGLHGAAGSTIVHEIHGSLFEVVSLKGRFVRLISRRQVQAMSAKLERIRKGWFCLPRTLLAIRPWLGLGRRGLHRPKLVLFGDALAEPDWTLARQAVQKCDCLIQIGCSGVVWPAAELPQTAKAAGACVIAIDPQRTPADIWLRGTAAEVMPALVKRAFGDR